VSADALFESAFHRLTTVVGQPRSWRNDIRGVAWGAVEREARCTLAHPFYWAPFIVVGDDARITPP
jgi:CHAT domain-containing protein